jgi:hypothetical protein
MEAAAGQTYTPESPVPVMTSSDKVPSGALTHRAASAISDPANAFAGDTFRPVVVIKRTAIDTLATPPVGLLAALSIYPLSGVSDVAAFCANGDWRKLCAHVFF